MIVVRYLVAAAIALGSARLAYVIADDRQKRRWQQRGWALDRAIYRLAGRLGITMLSNKDNSGNTFVNCKAGR